MAEIIYTDAIVVGVRNLGESDRIVTLLSPAYGKLRAVCQGARRPQNRLAAGSQLFTQGSFVLRRRSELHRVQQIEVKRKFNIDQDLLQTTVAACMCEIASELTMEDDAADQMYALLTAALTVLAAGTDALVVLLRFFLRSVSVAGFSPVVEHCSSCGDEDASYFSSQWGGLACRDCSGGTGSKLTPAAIAGLRQLAGKERKLNIAAHARRELLHALAQYVRNCSEKEFKSIPFLFQLLGQEG